MLAKNIKIDVFGGSEGASGSSVKGEESCSLRTRTWSKAWVRWAGV